MRSILYFVMIGCLNCAYTEVEKATTYGHTYPPASSDASAPPYDPNADPGNDMYETGCFIQNIWGPNGQSSPPISYIVICNGRPFSVQDLIDPPPNDYHK